MAVNRDALVRVVRFYLYAGALSLICRRAANGGREAQLLCILSSAYVYRQSQQTLFVTLNREMTNRNRFDLMMKSSHRK